MNIHIEDNFLTSEECSLLIEYYHYAEKRTDGLDHFKNCSVSLHKIKYDNIRNLIEKFHYKLGATITKRYNESAIFPEFTNLVFWKKGKGMPSHYDAATSDVSARDYSCILYLNDDYEGGETYFKKSRISLNQKSISPKKGSILLFPSDKKHLHGVNKVKEGERYTLASWWTRDEKHIFYINGGAHVNIQA